MNDRALNAIPRSSRSPTHGFWVLARDAGSGCSVSAGGGRRGGRGGGSGRSRSAAACPGHRGGPSVHDLRALKHAALFEWIVRGTIADDLPRSARPIPRSSTSGPWGISATGCAALAASTASRHRSDSPIDGAPAARWQAVVAADRVGGAAYDCSQSRPRRKCNDRIASWVLPMRSPSQTRISSL